MDARYELPIAATVTTASVHDTKQFIPVLEKAKGHDWLRPTWVTADAGYDARYNYDYVMGMFGAVAVIKLNRRGGPVPKENILGINDPRRYPPLPRQEWNALYAKRQSVERCFSRLKGHRTLNDHCRRGLRKVRLHILMALVTLQADAVARAEAGDIENVRHCTRKVA